MISEQKKMLSTNATPSKQDPLVSIVIPCYKGSRYLPFAIESCLNQTHRDIEVIVVDDASPENDAEIAEKYSNLDNRVRTIRHTVNGGIARAFNSGFNAAKGDYFTRLAQDDLFRNDAIELMLDHFQSHPDLGLVYCNMQLIDCDGKVLQTLPTEKPDKALLPCNRVGLCVLWKREVWETIGTFNPEYDTVEDYDFFLRLSRRYLLGKCADHAPFFFRYHPTQSSVNRATEQDWATAACQFAHYWARVKEHPLRIKDWKHLLFGSIRIWFRKRQWNRSKESFQDISKV